MDVYGDDCGKTERLESEILNLGPGAPSAAATNGVACPDALAATLDSAVPPATRNAVAYAYPEVLTAHLGSVNSVAYPGGLGAVTTASENAAGFGYTIDVYEGVAGFDFDHLNPTGIAAAAAGRDGAYDDSSGLPLPFADKVVDDVDWDDDEVAGAAAERVRGVVLGRLGLGAAALAVAGITAGDTAATLATALGLFVMLIAGVTLVTVRVFRG